MPLLSIDLRDTQKLTSELSEASRLLASEDEAPARVVGLVIELHEAFASLDPASWRPFVDPYFFADLQQAAMSARAALDIEDEAERAGELEVALEALLDVLHDIEEGAPVREEMPSDAIVGWIKEHTGASNSELAALLGISERKLERWLSARDPASPGGDDEMRVRVLGRLVNQLRHAMTGRGALRWLSIPNADLGGAAPAELLDDPAASARLFSLARATRSSDAD
jgi:hypothetical protein